MKRLDGLAALLVLVGALNWGLVGVAKLDLVATVFGLDFGQTNAGSRIVYALVGVSAVYGVGSLLARRSQPAHGRQATPASASH